METNEELSHVPVRNELDERSTCGKWLQALGKCINKEIVFKGIKILGFIVLLILVLFLYGLDIFTKFQNNATTFTTKSHEADNLNMPPITFCMGNGLKPTVMKKYGIDNIYEFTFGSEAVMNMSSVWDIFVEAAYIINRDFKIYAQSLTWGSFQLTKGHNYRKQDGKVIGYDINVTEYHTILAGTCYQINSNFPLPPPNWISLKLEFNETLSETDIPQVNLLLLSYLCKYTSKNYYCQINDLKNQTFTIQTPEQIIILVILYRM